MSRQEVIYRHSGAVRATHWINVVALLVLLMSGLQIFNAHPALYFGSKSNFDDPVMAMRPMRHGEVLVGVTTIAGWDIDTTNLFGLAFGTTTLTLLDPADTGKAVQFLVRVTIDAEDLESRIEALFPGAQIKVAQVGTQILLDGQAPDSKTVAEILSPPDELILFCGMSIGYEDPTVSYTRTGRAPLDETVTFVEGSVLQSHAR